MTKPDADRLARALSGLIVAVVAARDSRVVREWEQALADALLAASRTSAADAEES